MAKCSKCDYKYATYESCPNCGANNPVSTIDEIKKIANRTILFALIVFICYIIWPVEITKVLIVLSMFFKQLVKAFTGG